MTRTFILRWTAAATLLAGAVALGTVMFGQAGRTAPPSVKLTRDTANNQDRGVPTVAYSGSTNFAQRASSDAGISRPAAPTPDSSGPRSRVRATSGKRRSRSLRRSVRQPTCARAAIRRTGLRAVPRAPLAAAHYRLRAPISPSWERGDGPRPASSARAALARTRQAPPRAAGLRSPPQPLRPPLRS